jgi:hypothetical protein
VAITEVGDGFRLSSTIPGNDGSVTYTGAEVAQFLADVKAGAWDGLHRRVRGPQESATA